jgi:hypothetical protein
MSSLLVFNRVYRLAIQLAMLLLLIFDRLCELLPLSPSIWLALPPFE